MGIVLLLVEPSPTASESSSSVCGRRCVGGSFLGSWVFSSVCGRRSGSSISGCSAQLGVFSLSLESFLCLVGGYFLGQRRSLPSS